MLSMVEGEVYKGLGHGFGRVLDGVKNINFIG